MCAAASIEYHPIGTGEYPADGMTAVRGKVLFGCSRRLLSQPFDQAVTAILAELGAQAGADRAWMFRYNEDTTLFRNTHEWCRDGLSEHGEDLQDVPTSMIAWLQEHLVERRAVMVGRIDALPRSAKALRREFERQRDKSVLSVPIFRDGKICACIGYDAVREERIWEVEEIHLLSLCGGLIAEAARGPQPGTAVDEVPRREGMIHLHGTDGSILVEVRKIIGVKAERDYTRVHYPGGGSTLELRPLKTWLSLLPKDDFQQIHRGAIVNVRRISGTKPLPGGGMTVTLKELGEEWSVSRTYRADLGSRLGF